MHSPETTLVHFLSIVPEDQSRLSARDLTANNFLIIVRGGTKLQIPLSLDGLRPADGPLLRVLITFLKSRLFSRFRLHAQAKDAVDTILRSLWAIWSDLLGIPTNTYGEMCSQLKTAMSSVQANDEDVTLALSGLVSWLKKEIGPVLLRYRPIGEAEVKDAVEQVYGVQLVLCVGLTADPQHSDGGREGHGYYWVKVRHRVESAETLLEWDKFPELADLGCT